MLQKFKSISSFVLLLFFGASLLQSISPLVMSEMGSHHGGEKMVCNIDGDCASSCSMDGRKSCSCNHAPSNSDSNDTMICGCDHHGNEPIGTTAPFQIKAPLVSAFDSITFSSYSIFLCLKQHHLFIFTDEIFHPPRPRV